MKKSMCKYIPKSQMFRIDHTGGIELKRTKHDHGHI